MSRRVLIALFIILALLFAVGASLVSAQEVKKDRTTLVPMSCVVSRDAIVKNAAKRNWYAYPVNVGFPTQTDAEESILKVMNVPGMGAMVGVKLIPVVGLFFKNVQFGSLVFEQVEGSGDACAITPAGRPAKELLKELVKMKKATGGK